MILLPKCFDRPVPARWRWFFISAFFVTWLGLTYHSIAPYTGSPSFNHFDKIQHIGAYGILAIMLALAWPRLRLRWLVILPALYGIGLEIAQALMPFGRTGSVWDALANLLGASVVVIIWMIWVYTQEEKVE